MSKIKRIRTGFLTGNMITEETQNIDVEASAIRYMAQVHNELQVVFPEATINIWYEHGSGLLPGYLRTEITFEDYVSTSCREAGIVDNVKDEIFNKLNWMVEK